MLPIVRWNLVGIATVAVLFVAVVPKTEIIQVETARTTYLPGGGDTAMIPMRALVRTDSGWSAYVIVNERAWEHAVGIRPLPDSNAAIISGLRADAPVVLNPPANIKNKIRIRRKVAAIR